ncbi:unnamed protein product [Ectocarpus fasciculatus]
MSPSPPHTASVGLVAPEPQTYPIYACSASERLNHLRYKDQSSQEWTGRRSCQSIPGDTEAGRRRRSSDPARTPPVRFFRRGSCHTHATVRIQATAR